jgi:hypothetical protein
VEINGARDEKPKVLFERTSKEPFEGKEHESCPRCIFVDKDKNGGERGGGVARHGGVCYRKLQLMAYWP